VDRAEWAGLLAGRQDPDPADVLQLVAPLNPHGAGGSDHVGVPHPWAEDAARLDPSPISDVAAC
jgi:hypothetical protein